MPNEMEATKQGLNAAKAAAASEGEEQQVEQLASALDDSEDEVTVHQSIDEYNHI